MSSSYDDLRDLVSDDDSDSGQAAARQQRTRRSSGKLFGLSAGQRAFLAVMLFVNVVIIGLLLMVVTGRMAF
jgi:hypothetical protein